MKFNIELAGVIDAETQDDADTLAVKIARHSEQWYGPIASVSGEAVLARLDVEVVIAKRPVAA